MTKKTINPVTSEDIETFECLLEPIQKEMMGLVRKYRQLKDQESILKKKIRSLQKKRFEEEIG